MPMHLSWLLLGSAAALRPQVTRRSLCGAAPALVLAPPALLAPTASRAAEGPTEALLPEAIYAGNDWIADRKLTIIEGDEKAAETAWRALGGAGAFEVLHKEQYTAGFKPTNEKMSFNSEKFPTWASTATGSVAVDRSVEVASRGGKSTQLKSAGVKIEDIGRGQIGTKELFIADGCVEINQCVGRTRQFFTKSFLGDDTAVLARSSGEEPALLRHRARRFRTNAP